MINEDSPIPLYYQVAKQLKEDIDSGKYKPGQRIPSEKQLCDFFDVSRVTIRLSLRLLENSYTIYRKQGQGTFVTKSKIKTIGDVVGFTEKANLMGLQVSSKVLVFKQVENLPDEISHQLDMYLSGTEIERPLLLLKRLRFTDGIPVAIEDSYIPRYLTHGIEKYDFSNRSLYKTLIDDLDLQIVFGFQIIRTRVGSEEESQQLQISPGTPLLNVFKITLTEHFRVVEYLDAIYNTDKYKFFCCDSREL